MLIVQEKYKENVADTSFISERRSTNEREISEVWNGADKKVVFESKE